PPGGGVDIVARLMADQVGRAHGATFVIENRPGAGTQIATEAVARAAPDGNTNLFLTNSSIINAGPRKFGSYPRTIFKPVCLLTRSPTVVAVIRYSTLLRSCDLTLSASAELCPF